MTPPAATVISNVRVFDGLSLGVPRTVAFSDGVIVEEVPGGDAELVDGAGGVLLPGLIDAHVHVDTRADLEHCLMAGITTVVDMGTRTPRDLDQLRDQPGVPTLLRAGLPASAPGGMQTKKMGFPDASAVRSPADAARFVAQRVADGSDFIKIIVEDPKMPGTAALPPDSIGAIVTAAHEANRRVVAHAVTSTAVNLAADAGVDAVTHAPVDRPISWDEAASFAARGIVLIPTLTMMRGTAAVISGKPAYRLLRRIRVAPAVDFVNSRESVTTAHRAGVTILAGTDSNNEAGAPAHPRHGTSLHDELALLVEAGLTPVEAINTATSAAAGFFGRPDLGSIGPGRRADLMLLRGDPTVDIGALRDVSGIWLGGKRIHHADAATPATA